MSRIESVRKSKRLILNQQGGDPLIYSKESLNNLKELVPAWKKAKSYNSKASVLDETNEYMKENQSTTLEPKKRGSKCKNIKLRKRLRKLTASIKILDESIKHVNAEVERLEGAKTLLMFSYAAYSTLFQTNSIIGNFTPTNGSLNEPKTELPQSLIQEKN